MDGSVSSLLDRLLEADSGRPLAALVTAQAGGLSALLEIGETRCGGGAMPAELAAWRPGVAGSPADARSRASAFESGWLFAMDYEHAGVYEPSVRSRHLGTGPTATWMRFRRAGGDARASHAEAGGDARPTEDKQGAGRAAAAFTLGPLTSRTGRAEFERSVRAALAHIGAGDVYQINLTHQLTGRFSGSARGLFAALVRRAEPWFGAYLELPAVGDGPGALPARCIASASPEMFLTIGPGGVISTRPMKGTRAHASLAADLAQSEKERAELTMIIDLMRNDLGRVCRPGSIHVPAARVIETHAAGSLLQATGTVAGVLREGATLGDVLAATFPPGSITGAPKVRAMRIIDELEPVARGPYCGIIGYATDDGHAAMSVAIRTAVIEGGTLRYGVGAGIVADSDPASEWEETLAKAGVVLGLCGEG